MRNMVRRFLFRAALVLFAAFMLVMMFVSRNYPNDWLLGPASPTLIRVCAIIAVVYYTGWALVLFVAHQRERLGWTAGEPLWRGGFDEDDDVTVVSMASRRGGPPTQPIPVPPDEAASDD